MRTLQYKVELEEYTVVSGSKCLDDSNYGQDSLPINLTILTLRTLSGSSKLSDAIHWGSTNSDEHGALLIQHFEEILRGKSEEWILSDFMVSPRELSIGFYNIQTKKTDSLCFLEPCLLRFQFDVPSQKHSGSASYIVELSTSNNGTDKQTYLANIEEFIGDDKCCEISMYQSDKDSPDTRVYASITEYVHR